MLLFYFREHLKIKKKTNKRLKVKTINKKWDPFLVAILRTNNKKEEQSHSFSFNILLIHYLEWDANGVCIVVGVFF